MPKNFIQINIIQKLSCELNRYGSTGIVRFIRSNLHTHWKIIKTWKSSIQTSETFHPSTDLRSNIKQICRFTLYSILKKNEHFISFLWLRATLSKRKIKIILKRRRRSPEPHPKLPCLATPNRSANNKEYNPPHMLSKEVEKRAQAEVSFVFNSPFNHL